MYLQITTRCNMTCHHCGFACDKTGEDMSMDTVNAAIDFMEDYGTETVSVGGGEPTIHPKFKEIIWELVHSKIDHGLSYIWLATNGKYKKMAMWLLRMQEEEHIAVELSQDIYHDPIDLETVEAFERLGKHDWSGGFRGIRNTTESKEPIMAGRAITEVFGYDEDDLPDLTEQDCICPGWIIKPNGDVHQCGCDDSPKIGDVYNGIEVRLSGHDCWRDPEYRDELIEQGMIA